MLKQYLLGPAEFGSSSVDLINKGDFGEEGWVLSDVVNFGGLENDDSFCPANNYSIFFLFIWQLLKILCKIIMSLLFHLEFERLTDSIFEVYRLSLLKTKFLSPI